MGVYQRKKASKGHFRPKGSTGRLRALKKPAFVLLIATSSTTTPALKESHP